MKFFIKKYKVKLILIGCWLLLINIVFFFSMQFEIILYFFPDFLIQNLNELYKNEVFLTVSNSFSIVKGYIFSDPDFYYKTALLSTSYGFIKYRRYTRHLRILRSIRSRRRKMKYIYFLPLNKKTKKYPRPLLIRYLYHLTSRNVYFRLLLLNDLLSMSSFSQILKLLYWEYTEKNNLSIQKRRIYQRFVALRNTLRAYPAFYVKRIFYTDVSFFNHESKRLNALKNYNYYNIYKKFSKYIHKGFFTDTIEPFRAYNLYLQRRKPTGIVPRTMLFNYWYDDWGNKHYMPRKKYKELVSDKYSRDNFFKNMVHRGFKYHDYFDYMGFGKNIRTEYSWGRYERRRYRFRFSRFYNEKLLFNNSTNNFRKLRLVTRKNQWRFQKIIPRVFIRRSTGQKFTVYNDPDYDSYKPIRRVHALDMRTRAGFWKRLFTRYGYRPSDYIYKNYDYFFKKYYVPIMGDFFVFPGFYKIVHFFDFVIFNFFKLNNFFFTYFRKLTYYINYKDNLIKISNYKNEIKDIFYKSNNKVFMFNWNFFFFNFLSTFFSIIMFFIYIFYELFYKIYIFIKFSLLKWYNMPLIYHFKKLFFLYVKTVFLFLKKVISIIFFFFS